MKIDTHLFNRLWAKAVGTPSYSIGEWMELLSQINQINREYERATPERLGPRSEETVLFRHRQEKVSVEIEGGSN